MAEQPGAVRDAIVGFLERKGTKGATLPEIRHAVNAALGHDVAASSVRSYLNNNVPAKFERVGRGTYRTAKA